MKGELFADCVPKNLFSSKQVIVAFAVGPSFAPGNPVLIDVQGVHPSDQLQQWPLFLFTDAAEKDQSTCGLENPPTRDKNRNEPINKSVNILPLIVPRILNNAVVRWVRQNEINRLTRETVDKSQRIFVKDVTHVDQREGRCAIATLPLYSPLP